MTISLAIRDTTLAETISRFFLRSAGEGESCLLSCKHTVLQVSTLYSEIPAILRLRHKCHRVWHTIHTQNDYVLAVVRGMFFRHEVYDEVK